MRLRDLVCLAGRTGLRTTGDHFGASVFLKVPIFVISNMAQDLGRAAGWAKLGRVLAAGLVAWAFGAGAVCTDAIPLC